MAADNLPQVAEPADEIVLTLLGTDADFRGRVETSLVRLGVPAVLLVDVQRGVFHSVLVKLLSDKKGRPLRWATHAIGVHGLQAFEWTDLVAELSTELDSVVATASGIFGGAAGFPWAEEDVDEDPDENAEMDVEIAAIDSAFAVESFTWYTPGAPDIVGLIAQQAGQALTVCATGPGYVAGPTESPNSVSESGCWQAKGGVFLARSGDRRGAGFSSKQGPVVHWWDERWILVDPSQPWEVDADGRRVRDYVDLLVPHAEPSPWMTNFGLDDERAEQLRVLLRKQSSDDETFDRLVTVLGLPTLLSDVASERVKLVDVDGVETIQPSTLRQELAATFDDLKGIGREFKDLGRELTDIGREEWERPLAGQDRWREWRRRRAPGYLALMGTGFVLAAAMLVMRLAEGADLGSTWWRFALLAYCILEVAWPRRGTAPDHRAFDATEADEAADPADAQHT
ncbi:hypothetical protein [Mycetocola sp. 2940]|uniref:hypothetical protein n=1 Tax=Mycetocola sp. 2940 TaxID=3156452 RepID=UPI003397B106